MRRRWVIAVALVALLALAGGALAAYFATQEPDEGRLLSDFGDVTVVRPPVERVPEPPPPPEPEEPKPVQAVKESCWPQFGRTPAHVLSTPVHLGVPRKHDWVKPMGGYIEYPPVFDCETGTLYLNVVKSGKTVAVRAEDGKTLWERRVPGALPSSPAIAGPYLIVASKGGSVTAYRRSDGEVMWRLKGGPVESSPTVVDNLVYFASTDGRLYAVYWRTGRVKWAYEAAKMNSSPVVWQEKVCNTTYAGTVFCLDRQTGRHLWTTTVSRDAFRQESFYASASTDGKRLYSLARSGKVVALRLSDGDVQWTASQGGYGYTTPAVFKGVVYTGGFDGYIYAYRAGDGRRLWRTHVGGRFLGSPVVVGDLVFAASLEKRTFALRRADGRVAWRFQAGKYSPLIATERRYYMTLNGLLISWRGRYSPAE